MHQPTRQPRPSARAAGPHGGPHGERRGQRSRGRWTRLRENRSLPRFSATQMTAIVAATASDGAMLEPVVASPARSGSPQSLVATSMRSWRHSRAMSRALSARSRISSVVKPWAG